MTDEHASDNNDFPSLRIYNQPPRLGWVEVAPGFKIAVIGRWPNAFHRWTTRLAFGWRWEKSNDK